MELNPKIENTLNKYLNRNDEIRRICKIIEYTTTLINAHVSFGSQPQYLPQDSLAQTPPKNVPIVNNSFLKKVNLGKIPIMLHSKLCCLDKMLPETLTQMGESRYDPGGYFIVEGREKVIICNERRAENQVLILKSGIEKYQYIAQIKSISEEQFLFARTCS